MSSDPKGHAWLENAVAGMLARIERTSTFELERMRGGGNNRLYRVRLANGELLSLKAYFSDRADPRARGPTEFAFAEFAWHTAGLRCVPEPLVLDAEAGAALYEFVDGRPFSPRDVDSAAIDVAVAFVSDLNRHRDAATHLPVASEACFRMVDHVDVVTARVNRLMNVDVEAEDKLGTAMTRFVRHELMPTLAEVRTVAQARLDELGLDPRRELKRAERCVSPSDFGYHNALRTEHGVVFVDFEYAGWDDPGKLVADFFAQVAVPVPREHYERFAAAVVDRLRLPTAELERFRILGPLYRIKWICIILNEFSRAGDARRRFASGRAERGDRRAEKLDLARALLAELRSDFVPDRRR